ncbi:24444_t:CDS:2, partial [Gigaspora margarita]
DMLAIANKVEEFDDSDSYKDSAKKDPNYNYDVDNLVDEVFAKQKILG